MIMVLKSYAHTHVQEVCKVTMTQDYEKKWACNVHVVTNLIMSNSEHTVQQHKTFHV